MGWRGVFASSARASRYDPPRSSGAGFILGETPRPELRRIVQRSDSLSFVACDVELTHKDLQRQRRPEHDVHPNVLRLARKQRDGSER
jgi:hypothetical protein